MYMNCVLLCIVIIIYGVLFRYTIGDYTYYVVIKLNIAFIKVGGVGIVTVYHV